MAYLPLLTEKQTFWTSAGAIASGYKLFIYAAGTTTKATTYQETTGTANTNPVVLNSRGEVPYGVYVAAGSTYKLVLAPSTDSDPPVAPVWTRDNLSATNDTTVTVDQWQASGFTPTYVSATSFTVTGDRTSTFQVGRRVKTTNTGGTIYSTVVTSAYGALTTVTVVNDSGVLDSGLSAVSIGLLTPTNPSVPALTNILYRPSSTLRTGTFQDRNVVIAAQDETQDSYMLQNATLAASVAGNILTVALKNASGSDCSSSSPASIAFRSTTATVGTFSVRTVTAALSTTVSAGSTLGFANSESGRIHVGLIDNAGTVEMCVWRALSGLDIVSFAEWTVQTTTAEGGAGAADSAATLYSTTARSNVAFRYLGSLDIQYGTAQWSNAPTRVQTATRNSPRPGDIITSRVSYTGAGVSSAGALGSGTTQVPLDDTIPTSTEGDEYLILNHAPTSAVNLLQINWSLYVAAASPATAMTAFLNKDAGSALSAVTDFGDNGAGNAPRSIYGDYSAVAGGTSSSAWRVRAGPGSAATMYVNGAGAARRFGGVCLSNVRLEEVFT